MAATVNTEVWTGGSDGSPNKTDASTIRFRTDDSPTTIDTTNPLVIPDSGENYSFWVHLAINWSGTYDEISNIRFHTDGSIGYSLGTGGQLRRGNQDSGDNGVDESNYEVASGTVGTTGDSIESTYSFYSGQTTPVVNAENDTSGSPATIDSTTYTTDGSSKAVVLQPSVDTDASSGVQSDETLTILYDEI